MSLTSRQTAILDELLEPHFQSLSEETYKPKRFQALKLALKPESLDNSEIAALSQWTNKNGIPLLPSVAVLRGMQQRIGAEFPEIGLENQEAARKYIADRIRTRLARLRKEKITPAAIPELSEKGAAALKVYLLAYLTDNISKTLQAIHRTAGEIIHSDDKRIRYAIDYALSASLSALMKGTEDPGMEVVTSAIGGAIGGAVINAVDSKYQKIAGFAVDGAVSEASANIKKGFSAAALAALISSGTKAITSIFSNNKDVPDFADGAVNNFYNNGTIASAIYGMAQRSVYKIAWKKLGGKGFLKERDMVNFLSAYFDSAGLAKISGYVISEVGEKIIAEVSNYTNKQKFMPETVVIETNWPNNTISEQELINSLQISPQIYQPNISFNSQYEQISPFTKEQNQNLITKNKEISSSPMSLKTLAMVMAAGRILKGALGNKSNSNNKQSKVSPKNKQQRS